MRATTIGSAFAMAGALILAVPAAAQSPSADQIIQSLRPTGPGATTRGIRPVGPSGPSAPSSPATPAAAGYAGPVRPRAPGPASAANPAPAPSVDLTVNFATGSADLTPQATRTLDELGRALTSATLSGFRYRIEGHTDTVGAPEANKALSDRRAAAVVDYLATKWKVDRSKVESVGMGQDQLLVPTGPGVAQPRNRRVTVINLGA
jgi:OOP family OmpA-OmpF porin